jgi:CDP-paratose 2-epimerase
MKYLITGGLGVIGSLISADLIARGHTVTIIDDGDDRRHAFNAPETDLIFQNRLEEMAPDILAELVGQNDRVLHAAASTGIPYSTEEPRDDWTRNVDGTIALLEALRLHPKPTVVLSSVKPYGLERLSHMERPSRFEISGTGVDETFPLLPDEPYAASKAAQSLICMAYARSYGLPLTVFRCSNLYGPAACHGPRHGWLTWFCISAALGWPIEIQGPGNQTRDMLYWTDVHAACDRAWGAAVTGLGYVLNLGGGRHNTVSPLEAVATLRSLGASIETVAGPGRKHEDMLFVTETGGVESVFGWRPHVQVEDGIGKIYEWACANRKQLARAYEEYGPGRTAEVA